MYSMTRVRSALIAVKMSKFCKFLKLNDGNTTKNIHSLIHENVPKIRESVVSK